MKDYIKGFINLFRINGYYRLLSFKKLKIMPFPIIDNLPSDICEYLNINKMEFLNFIKKKENYKQKFLEYRKDYNEWLQNSDFYFYSLCRWHLQEKLHFYVHSLPFFQPKNLKILDFGSGIGTRSLIYSKRNAITLVEINKKLLDFSNWRFQKYNRKGSFHMKIPEGKKFDMILLFDVIGHLTEPKKLINQICSSLKKNGTLKITFDNFYETSENKIHRNKEINFTKLLRDFGLVKEDSIFHNYRKVST